MSSVDQKNNRWDWIFGMSGFVGFLVAAVATFCSEVVPQPYRLWVSFFGMVIAFSIPGWLLLRPKIVGAVRWMGGTLTALSPWLQVLGILLLCLILFVGWRIYTGVQRPGKPAPLTAEKTIAISMDAEKGAIFNSWERQQPQKRYITAHGDDDRLPSWGIEDYEIAYFSYVVDPKVQADPPDASSGGYMTFYGKPFDRLSYSKIRFEFKATETVGQPDVGIRLAVDDPDAEGDRERVTYELLSVKPYLQTRPAANGTWQVYTVNISELRQTRFEPPLPEGINKNHINKLVFFVNAAIVKECPKGKLWFRDVTILKQ